MTHDELLAKINAWEYSDYQAMGTSSEWPYKIIRAVIELHEPEEQYHGQYQKCWNCDLVYPCPTINTIEKGLE